HSRAGMCAGGHMSDDDRHGDACLAGSLRLPVRPQLRLAGVGLIVLWAMHVRCVHWRLVSVLLLVCGMFAAPASAQLVFESAGERALGMAGAFVAVADDATAVHWNPAGLAAGPFAG